MPSEFLLFVVLKSIPVRSSICVPVYLPVCFLIFCRKTYFELKPLTPEEKKQIVSAVGLSKGHWFKCPQGHIYAIGECGGAMQRSTCPECGAVIGGDRHTLVEGNELAPEMDGAQHPAWSEQANLQNYVL